MAVSTVAGRWVSSCAATSWTTASVSTASVVSVASVVFTAFVVFVVFAVFVRPAVDVDGCAWDDSPVSCVTSREGDRASS